MRTAQVGIAPGTKNATRIEIHTLRPGEDYWELYAGMYYSPIVTPGELMRYGHMAKDLHDNSVFTVRVVMHIVDTGFHVSTLVVAPHATDRSLIDEPVAMKFTMKATNADKRPKKAVR